MARTHRTQTHKEAQRAHTTTAFPQYPASTYIPRPYTTRISQPIQQYHNGTRQARRTLQGNNDQIAGGRHEVRSKIWRGLRELSRAKPHKICNGILAAVVIVGIILTVDYTLTKIDQSRH